MIFFGGWSRGGGFFWAGGLFLSLLLLMYAGSTDSTLPLLLCLFSLGAPLLFSLVGRGMRGAVAEEDVEDARRKNDSWVEAEKRKNDDGRFIETEAGDVIEIVDEPDARQHRAPTAPDEEEPW